MPVAAFGSLKMDVERSCFERALAEELVLRVGGSWHHLIGWSGLDAPLSPFIWVIFVQRCFGTEALANLLFKSLLLRGKVAVS